MEVRTQPPRRSLRRHTMKAQKEVQVEGRNDIKILRLRNNKSKAVMVVMLVRPDILVTRTRTLIPNLPRIRMNNRTTIPELRSVMVR